MFKTILLLAALTTTAQAADCPADHPIKRQVTDYTKSVTCTLLACIGTLTCPKEGPCFYVGNNSCNTCTQPETIDRCFSQAEIEAASGVSALDSRAGGKDGQP